MFSGTRNWLGGLRCGEHWVVMGPNWFGHMISPNVVVEITEVFDVQYIYIVSKKNFVNTIHSL